MSTLLLAILYVICIICGFVGGILFREYQEKRRRQGIEPPFFNFSVFEITRFAGIFSGIEILTLEFGSWTGSLFSVTTKGTTIWKVDLLWTRQLIEWIAADKV